MKRMLNVITAFTVSLVLLIVPPTCYSSAAYVKHILDNYPCRVQMGNNCWAYTIYTMGLYKGKSLVMPEQVMGYFRNANGYSYDGNGATAVESYNVIKYIFNDHSPKLSYSQLSNNEIIAQYSCDYPVFIGGTSNTTGTSHAVALVGYTSDDAANKVLRIQVMNPQSGKIEQNFYDPEGETYIHRSDYNDHYLWNGSIRLI